MNDEIENDPQAKERLRRAVHNFIVGSPFVAGELAKLRAVRDMLPKRLKDRGVPPESIALVKATLDQEVADAERELEQDVIELGLHKA